MAPFPYVLMPNPNRNGTYLSGIDARDSIPISIFFGVVLGMGGWVRIALFAFLYGRMFHHVYKQNRSASNQQNSTFNKAEFNLAIMGGLLALCDTAITLRAFDLAIQMSSVGDVGLDADSVRLFVFRGACFTDVFGWMNGWLLLACCEQSSLLNKMGNCMTVFGRRSTEYLELFHFTKTELDELKESWKRCIAIESVGKNILLSLIMNKPEFGRYFGLAGEPTPEKIKDSTKVKIQAMRIQTFLDTIVLSIGVIPTESIIGFCHNIGNIHFHRGVNFSENNWTYFQLTLIQQIVKSESGNVERHLSKIWRDLLNMIVQQIQLGFLYEAMKNFDNSSSRTPYHSNSYQMLGSTQSLNCIISSPQSINMSLSPRGLNRLQACKELWQRAKESKDIGMNILVEMIEHKPAYAKHFDVDPADKNIRTNSNIIVQAKRIQGFLDTIVTLYGVLPEEKLVSLCRHVGYVHFDRGINFTADIWLLFKKITIDQVKQTSTPVKRSVQMRQRTNSEFLVNGWELIMRFIIHEMKEGFLENARKQQRRHSSLR